MDHRHPYPIARGNPKKPALDEPSPEFPYGPTCGRFVGHSERIARRDERNFESHNGGERYRGTAAAVNELGRSERSEALRGIRDNKTQRALLTSARNIFCCKALYENCSHAAYPMRNIVRRYNPKSCLNSIVPQRSISMIRIVFALLLAR